MGGPGLLLGPLWAVLAHLRSLLGAVPPVVGRKVALSRDFSSGSRIQDQQGSRAATWPNRPSRLKRTIDLFEIDIYICVHAYMYIHMYPMYIMASDVRWPPSRRFALVGVDNVSLMLAENVY